VAAGPVGDLVRDGVLLPHDGAALVGPTFTQWLSTTVQSGATAGAKRETLPYPSEELRGCVNRDSLHV